MQAFSRLRPWSSLHARRLCTFVGATPRASLLKTKHAVAGPLSILFHPSRSECRFQPSSWRWRYLCQREPGDGSPNRCTLPSSKEPTVKGVEVSLDVPPPPIVLEEDDIEESFIRGSGPGGQKINKTASCVMLRHIPTGTVVRCQESRSRHRNRELARRILRDKLDLAIRGEHSRLAMEANKERARKAVKRRKTIKKHFKSRRDRAAMG